MHTATSSLSMDCLEGSAPSSLDPFAHQVIQSPITQAILESMPGFAFILNEDRKILATNQETLKHLDQKTSDSLRSLRTGDLLECIHHQKMGCGNSDNCTQCQTTLTAFTAIHTGKTAVGDCNITTCPLSPFHGAEYKMSCTPLTLENETLLLFTLQDISDEKRREALNKLFLHEVVNLTDKLEHTSNQLAKELPYSLPTLQHVQDLILHLKNEIVSQKALIHAASGSLELELKTVSPSTLFTELQRVFRHHRAAQDHQLDIQCGPNTPFVTDPFLLLRVLISMVDYLLVNTPAGNAIKVHQTQDGLTRCFTVENTLCSPLRAPTPFFQQPGNRLANKERMLDAYAIQLLGEDYLGGRFSIASSPQGATSFHLSVPDRQSTAHSPLAADGSTERLIADGFILSSAQSKLGTVLVVDDSPTLRNMISHILSRHHNVLTAKDGKTGLKLAKELLPDLILLEVVLPEMNGFDVCEQLKADPRTADIPVMFITAMAGDRDETRALEAGGIDFIHKPVSPAIVSARVRNHIELKHSRDKLKAISLIDGLTGIANRRRFDAHLEAEWRRTKRKGQPLSLIMGDVDFFKRYNDTYGHIKGDECLKQVAQAFASSILRAGDLAARFGGEEFTCILPETDLKGALGVAEKIHQALKAFAMPHQASEVSLYVSVSLGLATSGPHDPIDFATFLTKVDEKLYEAKRAGRNCTRY